MRNLLCRATVIALIGMGVPDNVTADVLDYYRFENNYVDSGSGGKAASVLTGAPAFSGNVPAAVIPRTGQSDTASLSLGTSAALVFNYAFPFNTLTNGMDRVGPSDRESHVVPGTPDRTHNAICLNHIVFLGPG